MEWQPIERAPRDGTEILAFASQNPSTYPYFCIVFFEIGRWWGGNEIAEGLTHWMRLPDPPKGE